MCNTFTHAMFICMEHKCHHQPLPLLTPPPSLLPALSPFRDDPEQGPNGGFFSPPPSSKAIAATVTCFSLPHSPLTAAASASPPSGKATHLNAHPAWAQSPPAPGGAPPAAALSPAPPADAAAAPAVMPAGSPLTPMLSPASLGFGMEGGVWFLDVVKAATDGFADKNVIGRGGFGTVYKVRGRGSTRRVGCGREEKSWESRCCVRW